jgi:hypothetical protein
MAGSRLEPVPAGAGRGLVVAAAALGMWARPGVGLELWHWNCPFDVQVGDWNGGAVAEPRPTVHPASVVATVTSSAMTKIGRLIAEFLPRAAQPARPPPA